MHLQLSLLMSNVQIKEIKKKKSYQSQGVLYDGRESVLLHHKDIRGLTHNCEPIGVTVEAHRTNKVLELRQEVGQLRGKPYTTKDHWQALFYHLVVTFKSLKS